MADPISLRRPPAGHRYDPTAIDATGATLGDVLTATSDGTGGQRAAWATPAGGGGLPAATPDGAILAVLGGAWVAAVTTVDSNGDVVTGGDGNITLSLA
jgi:hypothetical protein